MPTWKPGRKLAQEPKIGDRVLLHWSGYGDETGIVTARHETRCDVTWEVRIDRPASLSESLPQFPPAPTEQFLYYRGEARHLQDGKLTRIDDNGSGVYLIKD